MDFSQTMNLIKRHEGLELKPYRCPAGRLTIGYGRNLDDVGIDEQEAENMLVRDMMKVVKGLRENIPGFDELTSARQAVLIDMAYNLGLEGLLKFKRMLGHVVTFEWAQAAEEMLNSKWARQVGSRANRLATMMETGRWAV